jgi:hypothetical protein
MLLKSLLLALALAVPTVAHADLAPPQRVGQAPPPAVGPRPGKPARPAKPDKDKAAKREALRARVQEVRMTRLIEVLGLDEATGKKLAAVVARHDAVMAPIRSEIRTLRADLAALVQLGKATPGEVNPRLDKLAALAAKREAAQAQLITEARAILTPEQAAKLVLALPAIDRALMRKVKGEGGGDGDDDDAPWRPQKRGPHGPR